MLVVQNAKLSSVRLKMFVIYKVSLLTYVKLAYFCVGGGDLFPCVVGRWFVWVYRKEIIVENVMDDVKFM